METEMLAHDPRQAAAVAKAVAKIERRTEFFWLCDRCASEMTLEYDSKGSVLVKLGDHDFRAAS